MPFTVFPLRAMTAQGTCTCNDGVLCPRPGKHPAILWGELTAGEQVHGPAGHGIATGVRSNIFVVDTDGALADERFRSLFGELSTYTVTTPSGGRHYYFVHPGFPVRNSQGEYLARDEEETSNIDIRGDGGFVVTPGSPHRSGREYEVEKNVAPAIAPDALLEWLGLRGRELVLSDPGANAPIPISTPEAFAERLPLAERACRDMPASIGGQNGSLALFNLSLHLIRDLELPYDKAHDLVSSVYNPRCEPAWSANEIGHKLLDARDKSDREPGMFRTWDLSRFARAKTPDVEPSTRKVHDPAHRYALTLASTSAISPSKTTPKEVTNILTGGSPAWAGVLQYDVFRDRVEAVDPPIELAGAENGEGLQDADVFAICHWFEVEAGLLVSNDVAWRAANAVARMNGFHPLREYLDAREPCQGAIEGLAEAMGLAHEHERMYLRRFLIAAVRRVYEPGCKVDNMLVLRGDPALKKSTFVLSLFGQEWASENLTDVDDAKKVGEVLAGKWAVEIAELRDILKAGNEAVAAFITRRTERFRAAYARGNAIDRPRTTVLIASTNEHDILRNSTGADARRFWIVEPTKRIDIAWIEENRDAVWGEARALAATGAIHWLEGEDERDHLFRMKGFEEHDPWHGKVAEFLVGKDTVSAEDVWKHVGGLTNAFGRRELDRITATLRRLGCERAIVGQGRMRLRVWRVPSDVAALADFFKAGSERTGKDPSPRILKNDSSPRS